MFNTHLIPCTILELKFEGIILGRLEDFKEIIINPVKFDDFKKLPRVLGVMFCIKHASNPPLEFDNR